MSKGTIALIGALFVLSVLVIVVISVAVALSGTLGEHDATRHVDFVELLWLSLMRTLDPGTMGGDTGSIPFVLSMLAVTLGGIFIISTLIGVIATGIEGRLADLRKGRSVVVEKGHTVILGWSPEVYSVIEQLVAANENKRGGHTIVVLADRDKVAMEDDIRHRIPRTGRSRIVCRSGSPIDLDELEICSPQTSRSLIVLSSDGPDPDADVIKTLLAITNAPNRRPEPYHLVTQIHDPRNLHVARLAGRGEAQLILGSDITGRIAAQTCRQPGLSIVYMELLDFGGNEIYFHEEPELAGTDFGSALHAYRDSSLIGIAPSDGAPVLNPPMHRPIRAGDRLVFVAQDDDTIDRAAEPGQPERERIAELPSQRRGPEMTLVLGWNRRTAAVLLELDRYVAPGSRLTVAATGADTRQQVEAVSGALRNHSLSFHALDTTDRRALDQLTVDHPDHVLIMSYSDVLDEQRADAHTLITLLHLRDIAEQSERGFSIVSEMLDLRNRNLAKATSADDFIVSDKLISLTMSQLAENPRLEAVFGELFDVEGSEIYLKPAGEYVRLDGPVNFHTVVEAARRRHEVAFGYRLMERAADPGRSFGVVLNPDKAAPVQLTSEDRIIVLAES